MEDQQQAHFDGWAIVDVMGHQRYIGYVTTEAYGAAVLFRVDVPALDERERTTKRPGYIGDAYYPAGTLVKEGGVQGYTKLIGSGSIYMLSPVTKEAALAALEEVQHRPFMSAAPPVTAGQLAAAPPDAPDDEDDPEDGFDHINDDVDEDEPVHLP